MSAENQNQANQAVDEAMSDQGLGDARVQQLEGELKEANDRALRTQAELENYRKRVQREMVDERKYAVIPVVRDLLPVVDNLERAIEAAQQSSDSSGLLDGVKMVATQLSAALAQHQCVRIESDGAEFDPNVHQAIGQEPSDKYPAGKVSRTLQAGYKLHDRVIRPAQVFVSTGPASPQ
jgi:molecular chaperone GrpE